MREALEAAGSILRSLREPVLVLDGNLRGVMANPAFYETLQIPLGQLEGARIQDLVADENGQPHLRAVLESVVAHAGRPTDVEVACKLPNGDQKVLSVTARRISFERHQSEAILVELRDITKRTEAEGRIEGLNAVLQKHVASLERANKELESFTHSASHDLQSPLRLTNKIAHLLLQDHGAEIPDAAVQKVEMILESTREMGKLIEDLLDFSRVSREPMKRRRVDLSRLVRESLEDLEVEKEGREVEITVEDLGLCQADRGLLKQVILNLLSNALKFTRPRKRARIVVDREETDGDTIYFVRDNGVGFNAPSAEEIFLPFHRLQRTSDFGGNGIGLALARRIVDRHGGRIWAEGEVDKGATFFFTLSEQRPGEK